MSSSLAQSAFAGAQRQGLFGGKGRKFYYEVCRCIPFIHKAMHLDEIVTVKEMRAVVKAQFKQYKDVKDPRVVDLLIFKGREELELYLTLHKQRHHAITDYLDPAIKAKHDVARKAPTGSAFLQSFLRGGSLPSL